jgi:hypothetical protein
VWSTRLALLAALSIALVAIGIPAAQAATYTYANNLNTSESQQRYSGLRTSISRATAQTQLGIGTVTVQNYYSYPGYSVVGYASTNNPYIASISHVRKTNLYSKCHWSAGGAGGETKITCKVYS